MKRINLIPKEFKRDFKLNQFAMQVFGAYSVKFTVIIVLFLAVLSIWHFSSAWRYSSAIFSKKELLTKLQAQLLSTKGRHGQIQKELADIMKAQERIGQKVFILKDSRLDIPSWAPVLVKVSEIIPSELWLDSITLDKEAVILKGTTFDNRTVSQFMIALDKSMIFQNTSFNFTQKAEFDEKPVINFEVITHVAQVTE